MKNNAINVLWMVLALVCFGPACSDGGGSGGGGGDADADSDGDVDADADGDADTDADGDGDADPFQGPDDILGTWAMKTDSVGKMSIVGEASLGLLTIPVNTLLDYNTSAYYLMVVSKDGDQYSGEAKVCKMGADPKENAIVSGGVELPDDLSAMPSEVREIDVTADGAVTMPEHYSAIGIDESKFDLAADSLPAWGSDWSEVDYIVDTPLDDDALPGMTSKLTASIGGNPFIDRDIYTAQISSSIIDASFENKDRISGEETWTYDLSVQKNAAYAAEYDFFKEAPKFTQSKDKPSTVEMIRLAEGATCDDAISAF